MKWLARIFRRNARKNHAPCAEMLNSMMRKMVDMDAKIDTLLNKIESMGAYPKTHFESNTTSVPEESQSIAPSLEQALSVSNSNGEQIQPEQLQTPINILTSSLTEAGFSTIVAENIVEIVHRSGYEYVSDDSVDVIESDRTGNGATNIEESWNEAQEVECDHSGVINFEAMVDSILNDDTDDDELEQSHQQHNEQGYAEWNDAMNHNNSVQPGSTNTTQNTDLIDMEDNNSNTNDQYYPYMSPLQLNPSLAELYQKRDPRLAEIIPEYEVVMKAFEIASCSEVDVREHVSLSYSEEDFPDLARAVEEYHRNRSRDR